MDELGAEVAVARRRKQWPWPWVLRDGIKELIDDVGVKNGWVLGGTYRDVLEKWDSREHRFVVVVWAQHYSIARIKEPVEIKLTTREWWVLNRKIDKEFASPLNDDFIVLENALRGGK